MLQFFYFYSILIDILTPAGYSDICERFSLKSICFLTNHLDYSNGVATALTGYANELIKHGFVVDVVCLFTCNDEFVKSEFDPRVNVIKVYGKYFHGMARIVDLLPDKLLYKKAIKKRYDVEVAFQFGLPTKILAASKNPNTVAWIHGYGEQFLKFHKRFSKIVTCAKDAAEKYKRVYPYPERIKHLYNLIDESAVIEKSHKPCAACKPKDVFVYGTVGRLSPEKGFDRLIKCYAEVKNGLSLSELWIVGEGKERDKLEKIIVDNGLNDRVKLFGEQSNPYNYVSQFDVFVCSSFSEGMSTACTEAMLLGVPCISTFVGGSEELIKEDGCGKIVYSDQELCSCMKDIYKNETVLKEYRIAIDKKADLRYADRAAEVIDFFENV